MTPLKNLPKKPEKYGPAVMAPGDYEAIQEVVVDKKNKYGPALLGKTAEEAEEVHKPTPPTSSHPAFDSGDLEALLAKYTAEDGYVSIKDLKTILEEMPQAFDRLFGWELNRRDGPRIGALQEFQRLEVQKQPPRTLVLQTIEKGIAKARGTDSDDGDDGDDGDDESGQED